MAGPLPLAHKDFIPVCLEEGGIFSHPSFERFDSLIRRANEWLQHHPDLKARTCESFEVKGRFDDYGRLDTEKVTYKEYGEHRNRYIRALRLWLVGKEAGDSPSPQQIGHVNVVPTCIEEGGIFSKPQFASYGDTLERLNQQLKHRPLPGKILSVETQDMKFRRIEGEVNPDETYWTEPGERGTYFLNIIRVFFQQQEPVHEEIGSADFLPEKLEDGGFMTSPTFRNFGNTVEKARHYFSRQSGFRIVSLQSIDYKLKNIWGGGSLDTHRTMFYERGEGYTYFVRILRVSYVRRIATQDPPSYSELCLPKLNYRTFAPIQLSDGVMTTPRFETMTETIMRATAWLRATRCPVLSVETVPVQLRSGNQYGDHEQVYTWNHGDRNKTWLFVVRVYLDGDYVEPPREVLPPVPQMAEDDCCVIL